MRFWCVTCERRTEPDDEFRCKICGEHYQCGECGFEIDRAGNCLRAEAGAGECPSAEESACPTN